MSKTTLVITAIILLGIAGVFARPVPVRITLWILSLPLLVVGILTLIGGGIAEPFTPRQKAFFCALTFWPAIGCIIGRFIIKARKRPAGES